MSGKFCIIRVQWVNYLVNTKIMIYKISVSCRYTLLHSRTWCWRKCCKLCRNWADYSVWIWSMFFCTGMKAFSPLLGAVKEFLKKLCPLCSWLFFFVIDKRIYSTVLVSETQPEIQTSTSAKSISWPCKCWRSPLLYVHLVQTLLWGGAEKSRGKKDKELVIKTYR